MTDAPVAGTVSRIPGKLLQAIRVPAFTSAIVASAPMTVIDPGVIAERHYNDPLHGPLSPPAARMSTSSTETISPHQARSAPSE
jgi:hypothetical protein